MKYEKPIIIFVLHFSSVLFVFLIGMYATQITMPFLPQITQNAVFSAIIESTRGEYTTGETIIGFFIFVFFLPLDLAIIYHATIEMASKKDIYDAIEKGFRDYPMFFIGFSSVYFFGLMYPFIVPLIIFAALRRLEPEIPWKYHALTAIMFSAWLIPISLVNQIDEMVYRRFLSFFFLMGMFLPFIGHANLMHDVTKKKK